MYRGVVVVFFFLLLNIFKFNYFIHLIYSYDFIWSLNVNHPFTFLHNIYPVTRGLRKFGTRRTRRPEGQRKAEHNLAKVLVLTDQGLGDWWMKDGLY